MNKTNDLLKLDVSKHIEQKQNLNYLSWAWAWDQALRADPDATFTVSTWTRDDGTVLPYMEINGTAMVWVTVKMFDKTRTCMLPVMNAKNQPIPLAGRTYKDRFGNEQIEKVDSFNVNTAIMRCMTKCLALFGLGLYIYAGEDLPLDDEEKPEDPKKSPKAKTPEPPKEKPVEPPEPTASENSKARANAELFAEGMLEFLSVNDTEAALMSYWMANEKQINKLKSDYIDLFTKVRDAFSDKKAKLKKEKVSE